MSLRTRDAASRSGAHWPSMTPMVDVVLVILVFFMASAAFLGPEWLLPVGVPTLAAPSDEPDPFALPTPRFEVRLQVADGSRVLVSGLGLDRAPMDALAPRVRSLVQAVPQDDLVVVLAPEDGVPYEAIVRARAICERAGARRVALR